MRNLDKTHRDAVFRKVEKIQGLKALLDTWEAHSEDSDEYRAYIRELKRRVRVAEVQFKAMKP
jgi:hypothetical protein